MCITIPGNVNGLLYNLIYCRQIFNLRNAYKKKIKIRDDYFLMKDILVLLKVIFFLRGVKIC